MIENLLARAGSDVPELRGDLQRLEEQETLLEGEQAGKLPHE